MVTADTIEGIANGQYWFHYDIGNDVLYIRLESQRYTPTVAEETPDGFLLLRREDNDCPVGLTVVNWWQRFGAGDVPGSIQTIGQHVESWTRGRLAA